MASVRLPVAAVLCALNLSAVASSSEMLGTVAGQGFPTAKLEEQTLEQVTDGGDTCSLLANSRIRKPSVKDLEEEIASLRRERSELQYTVKHLREHNSELQSKAEGSGRMQRDQPDELRELKGQMDVSIKNLEQISHLLAQSLGDWVVDGGFPKGRSCKGRGPDVSIDSIKFLVNSNLDGSSVLVNSSNNVHDNVMLGGNAFSIVAGSGNEVLNNTVINNSNGGISAPADRPHASALLQQGQAGIRLEARSPVSEFGELKHALESMGRLEKLFSGVLAGRLVRHRWPHHGFARTKHLNISIGSVLIVVNSDIQNSNILINSNNTIVNNTVNGGGPIVKGDNNTVAQNVIAWNNNSFSSP